MWRSITSAGILLGLALFSGCMSGPMLENPLMIRPAPATPLPNPVYLAQGPRAYGRLFSTVLSIVDDYFPEIYYSNIYDGRIVTFPKVGPGLGEPFKPGSPDFYGRLLATLQSIRLRAEVVIQPADPSGYLVDVKVYREVEDVAVPTNVQTGPAAFRSDPTVKRQEQVIDDSLSNTRWVPLGRDEKLEQIILDRIQCWDQPAKR